MRDDSFNVIFTTTWMAIFKRSQPDFNGIGLNAVAFTGSFLVKNEKDKELLMNTSLINVLDRIMT